MSRKLIQIIAIIVCSVFDISAKSDTEDSVETYIYENHQEAVDAINKLENEIVRFSIKQPLISDTIKVICRIIPHKNDYSLELTLSKFTMGKHRMKNKMNNLKYRKFKEDNFNFCSKKIIENLNKSNSKVYSEMVENYIMEYIAYQEYDWIVSCLDLPKARRIEKYIVSSTTGKYDNNLTYQYCIVYWLIPK